MLAVNWNLAARPNVVAKETGLASAVVARRRPGKMARVKVRRPPPRAVVSAIGAIAIAVGAPADAGESGGCVRGVCACLNSRSRLHGGE